MVVPNARYADVRTLAVPAGPTTPAFTATRARPIGLVPGVVEHVLRAGDRLDQLARHYYNDDRRWPIILDANPEIVDPARLFPVVPGDPLIGTSILVPRGDVGFVTGGA